MPAGSMTTFVAMFVMMIMLLIMIDPRLRLPVGRGMAAVLFPSIGFDALYPIYTILAASIIMVLFSTPIRHYLTDWSGMGKHTLWSKYAADLRKKAMVSGNPQMTRKANEMNMELMKLSSDRMGATFKSMIFTMIFAMLVFMWLSVFMYYDTSIETVSTPWDPSWDLKAPGPFLHIMPQWVILYSLLSLPLGQVLQGVFKLVSFPRAINKIEKKEAEARFRKKAGITDDAKDGEEGGEEEEEEEEDGKEGEEKGGEGKKAKEGVEGKEGEEEDLEIEETDELEIEEGGDGEGDKEEGKEEEETEEEEADTIKAERKRKNK